MSKPTIEILFEVPLKLHGQYASVNSCRDWMSLLGVETPYSGFMVQALLSRIYEFDGVITALSNEELPISYE